MDRGNIINILMLGNGYDLNYILPTSYRNFLLTIDFLLKHNVNDIHTVGDVFGDLNLQSQDKFIETSYNAYKEIYDELFLDKEFLQKLVNLSKNNPWYSYFVDSFNKDVGWIDFEKEIAFVVRCFEKFFIDANVLFNPHKILKDGGSKYIIMKIFNFFIADESAAINQLPVGTRKVKKEYTIEYPFKSENYIIDKEKIIKNLREKLNDFTELLRLYLQCFIEPTTKELVERKMISKLQAFDFSDVVITFNYTKTYEILDPNAKIFHIHGKTSDKIVLGINSSKSDEEEREISFVSFKKYFQRTLYDTDTDYLRWLRDILDEGGEGDVHLLVMGHSLDITDEDYIRDLIGLSSRVTVLYHNENAKAELIRNLIKIFGKKEFDRIRDERHLEFLSQHMDFSEFSKDRECNSINSFARGLDPLLY